MNVKEFERKRLRETETEIEEAREREREGVGRQKNKEWGQRAEKNAKGVDGPNIKNINLYLLHFVVRFNGAYIHFPTFKL